MSHPWLFKARHSTLTGAASSRPRDFILVLSCPVFCTIEPAYFPWIDSSYLQPYCNYLPAVQKGKNTVDLLFSSRYCLSLFLFKS